VSGALNADDTSYDTQVTVVERNRRLEITPLADAPGGHFNGYLSAGEWDLTGARVGVEVVQAAEMADTVFAVGIDSDNWYGFVAEEGTLYLQSKVNGVKSPKSVPYSAARQRFWRFRLDSASNTVTWETSPDGSSWEAQRRETLQMDITAVHVTLSAGTYRETKAPGAAVFDNFRLER
jgi:peptidoglycan hydrolase-like protein with peptidoglycan-binding domain